MAIAGLDALRHQWVQNSEFVIKDIDLLSVKLHPSKFFIRKIANALTHYSQN